MPMTRRSKRRSRWRRIRSRRGKLGQLAKARAVARARKRPNSSYSLLLPSVALRRRRR